jgi:hypothetical protein
LLEKTYMKTRTTKGLEIKTSLKIYDTFILIGAKEIVLEFDTKFDFLQIYLLTLYFLKKPWKLRQILNIYLNLNLEIEKRGIKSEITKDFKPEVFYKVLKGMDEDYFYYRNTTDSRLLGIELRFEENIGDIFEKNKEIFRILGFLEENKNNIHYDK